MDEREVDEREVDAWWDGLPAKQRAGIYRWLSKGEKPPPVHEKQADLLADLGSAG